MSTTPTATYLGRSVRWRGGDLYVPAEHCPPGAPVTHERVEVAPHVWELADGVRITAGDEGTVVAFLGVDELGEIYRVQFTSGAIFTLGLPQPHVIEVAA